MKNEIENLEFYVNELESELSSLKGQCSLLSEQINMSEQKIDNLEEDHINYKKSVELLNLVQKVTRDVICNNFETLVTNALQYIFQSNDYTFHLDFNKRGNLQELNFNIKKPELEEPIDPTETSGGGLMDIISLALRLVLMEVAKPKIEGPLILDESFKHLSSNLQPQALNFLKEMNQKMNRQIILITHQKEFINNADNLVEIK